MTSFTSRKTVPSTATPRFQISGRVQTGAAALLLGVSAVAMMAGEANAACAPATALPDNALCIGGSLVDFDTLAGDDTILIDSDFGAGYLNISGGADDDTITLNPALSANVAGTISGAGGNDTINLLDSFGMPGLGLSSVIDVDGGTGNDTITMNGAVVNNSIDGGTGDDLIQLLDGTQLGGAGITGNAGSDTIILDGASVNQIFGGDDDDVITLIAGGSAFLVVSGDDDNDTITLNGATADEIFGGDGQDVIHLLGGTAFRVSGDESLVVGGAADTIILDGATIDSSINGDGGDDLIELLSGQAGAALGGSGQDTITLNGASLSARIDGDSGLDLITLISGTAASVEGGGNNDTINLSGSSITGDILAQDGDDLVNVNSGSVNDVIGGDGNDTIALNGGNVAGDVHGDTPGDAFDMGDDLITLNGATVGFFVLGGAGNDTINLISGSGGQEVNAGSGDDTITLNGFAADHLHGGADDDTFFLLSGSANDVTGDGGNDIITLNGATVGIIEGDAGNDTIDLLTGTAGNVDAEGGDDTIQLLGATVTGNIDGGIDNDTISLLAGTVGAQVQAGAGNDTITLNGASVTGNVLGGSENDIINLLSGSAAGVFGQSGEDTITLDGASVAGSISGGDDDDTIDLLSGTANNVNSDAGDDTVTLNGAAIAINLNGGFGNDIIDLLSGVVGSNANGNDGNDTITLDGASIGNHVNGGTGDDTFFLTSGVFGDSLLGGIGSDTATIAPTFNLATIAGNLDGGDDTEFGDGFVDTLNIRASGVLAGEQILNWEIVNVINANLLLEGNTLVTAQLGAGGGVFLTNSVLDLDDGFTIFGDEVVIDGTSVLIAQTPGGTGVFSVSDDLVNMNLIDMSDGLGAGDTLNIGDDYTSFSELHLDVALNSTEAGDSLVIADNIFGAPTEITFTDTDPSGSPSFTGTGPGNGIVVIDNSVGGDIVDGDFVFDPISHPTNEILKVPFVYTLSLESDDILYLQSDVLAQVYGYAILSEMMRDQFPTLRDRLGDMRYNGYDSEGNPELGLDNAGLWARIDGSKRDIEHDGGHNTGEWNDTRGEASIGIDIPMETFGGVGVFGVSIHAVRGYADANSGLTPDPNVAEVDTTGFGGGLSFAWFPGGGFYADVQGRVTGWDADVENEARDLKQDIDGLGWGASLEVGNRFQIAPNTAIIPRGQVVYTDVDFDSFKDDDGVDVSQDDSASVVIGPGVTIEQMFPDNGVAMFLDASVKHELLDESSIDASGFRFKSGLEDTWGTVSFGASLGVAEGASAYVAGDVSSPLTSTFGDSYGYGLRAGVRIDF